MKSHVTRAMTLVAAALLVLATAVPAMAATQVIHDQQTFSVFVPCANGGLGETVEGLLKTRVVIVETVDAAGGGHFHLSLKLQGVGIGQVTGDTYRLHADIPLFFFERFNATAGGAENFALNYSIDAIGMGNAPNFHVNASAQVTINANGDVTMAKGDLVPEETCN